MEPGHAWRAHLWKRAKAEAAPRLSLMQVRMRMRRADELGMSYPAYASVRNGAGRDVGAMIFTSNALGLQGGALPRAVAERLAGVRSCRLVALLSAPLDPETIAPELPFAELYRAPPVHARWPHLRQAMARVQGRAPADSLLLIGAAPGEAEWAAAGRFGGYLEADAYFGG